MPFETNTHYIKNDNKIETDQDFYSRAIMFATIAHQNQRRKAGNIPYIIHPLGVANYAITIGKVTDINTIVGCILHDTVEDTFVTLEDIREHFGEEIMNIVSEVSDDKSLSQVERKRAQVANAKHKSNQAKIIKLCDTMYNLKDLIENPIWSVQRVQGYFAWKCLIFQDIKNTNKLLSVELKKIFNSTFTYQNKDYPVLPCNMDDIKTLKEKVNDYYYLLDNKN